MSTPDAQGGLECRLGVVTSDQPVQFHVHNFGHWLICCLGVIDVVTELKGLIRMLPGERLWVLPQERHKLTAPFGLARYACVGQEGL